MATPAVASKTDNITTSRTLRLNLRDAPPTQHWLPNRDGQHPMFLPDHLVVAVVNGRVDQITIRGKMLRVNGQPGTREGRWYTYKLDDPRLPEWARALIDQHL